MRQMRFDSTPQEETSRKPTKRQRISRACGPCRYAKLECNGQQPICSTCAQLRKHCTYNPTSKHRGLRPGYVRALELLWGLTFQELENAESVVDDLLCRVSKQDLATSSTRAEPDAVALPILERWKHSRVSRHLDDLLDENDDPNEEDAANQSASGGNGLLSIPGLSWEVIKKPNEDDVHLTPTCARMSGSPAQISSQQNQNVAGSFESFALPPQNLASRLLQLFFSHGQSWLPIVERHVILKSSFLAHRSSSQSQHGDLAALHGVYAYAVAVLRRFLDDERSRIYAKQQCETFYSQAFSMLPLDSEISIDLGHVQCTLLLALIRFDSGSFTASRRLLRHTINMLHELNSRGERISDHDALARTWLACFIIDTLTSACLHSKPLLCFGDVKDWCQINENGIEEWQEWHPPAQHESNKKSPVVPSEIPTHSLSLLVLHARLLHVLNQNLHHQISSGLGLENTSMSWVQDLSFFMSRESLTLGTLDESLDAARLPPGFVSLSATYTFISRFTASQTQESQGTNCTMTASTRERSPLPHITSSRLEQLSAIYAQLPVLKLLSHDWILLGSESLTNRAPGQSNIADPLHLIVEQSLLTSDIQTYQACSNTSGAIDSEKALAYQQIPLHVEPSQNTDMEQYSMHSMHSMGQTSAANVPLFDAQLDSVNAPFLEFLDTLDDRSIHDTELFNKSLGYTF